MDVLDQVDFQSIQPSNIRFISIILTIITDTKTIEYTVELNKLQENFYVVGNIFNILFFVYCINIQHNTEGRQSTLYYDYISEYLHYELFCKTRDFSITLIDGDANIRKLKQTDVIEILENEYRIV
jgi:hypothetical protein